jgi:hypothetical protein
MRYTIVEENDPEQMGRNVEALLKDGWELHGNLVLTAYVGDDGRGISIYAQALTNEQGATQPPAEMSPDEAVQVLANLLKISVDQLPPATQENREKVTEKLQGLAKRTEDKSSETE